MLTKDILTKLAKQDEDKLRELVAYRSKTEEGDAEDEHFLDYLMKQGVIYSTTVSKLDARLQKEGLTLGSLGLEQEKVVENGWLFPLYDAKDEWLYWVNYSNKRDNNKKYLNVVQAGQHNKLVFGLDTLEKALEVNQLVWVEGVIDQCRLASYGVPTVATLGTTVTDYMQRLAKRVTTNIIIPDNDANEKTTIGKDFGAVLQKELPNARVFGLTYVKDVDECFSAIPEQFFWIIDQLKKQ